MVAVPSLPAAQLTVSIAATTGRGFTDKMQSMCGRFVLKNMPVELIVKLAAGDPPSIGFKLINARSETAADKPSFRAAFKHRRCLIPADGFYEWAKKGKARQPFYIHRADGRPPAMAGLWEHWQDPHGNELETCTILATQANAMISPLHERMPVILEPEDWERWLKPGSMRGDSVELRQLMRSAAEGVLSLHPVSSQVNSPGVDTPDNLKPVEIKEPDRPEKNNDEPTLF